MSSEEDINDISLIVAGETSSGKKTLLSSFENFLFGNKYEDKFRHKSIFEKYDYESKSITKNVNIYNIASNGNFPSFKII